MLELKRMRFPKEIILVCIRCYAAYGLSYRNLEEIMQERGVTAATRFFQKAMKQNGDPEKVTMDKSGSNKAAIDAINEGLMSRSKFVSSSTSTTLLSKITRL